MAAILVIGFPRGFEANAYHLPSAVNFFRDGSLRVWDARWLHTLPANASLWDGFWLRVLPERLVSVVNLPFLGLCVLLLYRLCRYSGADRSAAALISCGLTTIPLFGFCALELGADVAGVAFSLAALWLVLSSTAGVSELAGDGGSGERTRLWLQTIASRVCSGRRAADPLWPRTIRADAAWPSRQARAEAASQRLFWHLPGYGCCATGYSWEIRFTRFHWRA